jgi:uncharacterized protein YkwD
VDNGLSTRSLWGAACALCAIVLVATGATTAVAARGPHAAHAAHAAHCSKRTRGHGDSRSARKHTRAGCAAHAGKRRHGANRAHRAPLAIPALSNLNLATIGAASCPNSTLVPEAANVETVEAATVCLVNRERARDALQPLAENHPLAQAALAHSRDMLTNAYFSHVNQAGETVSDRLRSIGYIYNSTIGYDVGENIAWGSLTLATPQETVAAWMASPEHRSNILNGAYTETGVGVVAELPPSFAEGQAGAMYTQDFGVIVPT